MGTSKTNRAFAPETGLRIRGMHFTYPAHRRHPGNKALDGIDLDVSAGESVALLGPNGSGKSTLIKIICGLLPPDSGTVELAGATRPVDIRPAVSVVFQSNGLDRHLTVYENLRDQATLYGIPRHEARTRIDRELERVGLADRQDHLVKTLSRGLARRVDLARAMLHEPRLLMLDEPTSGLDPAAREAFLAQLPGRQSEDPMIVLKSTHLVDEADRCDRVVLLHQGRIVADGTPAALRRRLGVRRVTVLDAAPPTTMGDARWERSAKGWTMPLADNVEQVKQVAVELAAAGRSFSMGPPTLADVFEQLTGVSLDATDGRDEWASRP
jgi:ABC-2 type transport system ATP-binding protein